MSMDDQIEKCQTDLAAPIQLASGSYDYRIVLAVLVTSAAELASAAISTGAFTPAQAADYFFSAFKQVLEPRAKKAALQYIDNGQPIGRKQ